MKWLSSYRWKIRWTHLYMQDLLCNWDEYWHCTIFIWFCKLRFNTWYFQALSLVISLYPLYTAYNSFGNFFRWLICRQLFRWPFSLFENLDGGRLIQIAGKLTIRISLSICRQFVGRFWKIPPQVGVFYKAVTFAYEFILFSYPECMKGLRKLHNYLISLPKCS